MLLLAVGGDSTSTLEVTGVCGDRLVTVVERRTGRQLGQELFEAKPPICGDSKTVAVSKGGASITAEH